MTLPIAVLCSFEALGHVEGLAAGIEGSKTPRGAMTPLR